MPKRNLDLIAKYDAANCEIAQAILANPDKHRGLALEWARLWMTNHPAAARAHARAQKPTTTQVTGSRLLWEEAS
jgi:hypothetical protein